MTDQPNTQPDPDETAKENEEAVSPLERAASSIREAQDAEGEVAAHDDITTLDDERAGEYSEDPGAEGGHP